MPYVRTTIRWRGFKRKAFRRLNYGRTLNEGRDEDRRRAGRGKEHAARYSKQHKQGDAAADHREARPPAAGSRVIDGSGIAIQMADAGLTRTNRPLCPVLGRSHGLGSTRLQTRHFRALNLCRRLRTSTAAATGEGHPDQSGAPGDHGGRVDTPSSHGLVPATQTTPAPPDHYRADQDAAALSTADRRQAHGSREP
jgi:hypothetical protein